MNTALAKSIAIALHTDARPRPVLKAGVIYSGDNGMLICVHCAGMRAKFTGRDLSGHKVRALGSRDAAEWSQTFGTQLTCERGCTKYL